MSAFAADRFHLCRKQLRFFLIEQKIVEIGNFSIREVAVGFYMRR